METSEKKDLTTPVQTGVVATFGEGEVTGFEGAKSSDMVAPFLRILQKMSPQCDPDKDEYMEAAKPGLFFQADTKEITDKVTLIPCVYRPSMIERKLKADGKVDLNTFVAEHPVGSEVGLPRAEGGHFLLPNGNCLDDTRTWFCLRILPNGDLVPVIVPMRSTQIKVSKRLFTELHSYKAQGKNGTFRPPMYVHIYNGTTVAEENEQGSWRSWSLDHVRVMEPGKDDLLFEQAKKAHAMFSEWASSSAKPLVEGAAEPAPF